MRGLDPNQTAAIAVQLRERWNRLAAMAAPNEATTERELIEPAFALLGWEFLPQQPTAAGRRDIPDALLFGTADAKARAAKSKNPGDRYPHAVVVVENEARDTLLDRAGGKDSTPASQILRYLALAEPASGGKVRWGLLTNGRFWRLYFHGARSRAEGFIGFDLPALLDGIEQEDPDGMGLFRTFLLFFRREAHDPTGPSGATFLDTALAEGRRYEQAITAALSNAVFERVFPRLIRSIAKYDPNAKPASREWRQQVKDSALILLYRLLFLLYAEDRELLPIRHPGYAGYALRRLRDEAAQAHDTRRPLSISATRWWRDLLELFRAIAEGDASLALPPYNGGLFDQAAAPLLTRIRLPDAEIGELIDRLSREALDEGRRLINFRDLSVQQLGSIYERLLEFEVVSDDAGGLTVRLSPFARKDTGSYYTPEELVRLIIRRAVGPLLEERRAVFRERATVLASDRRPKSERLADLERSDPARSFLSLRVVDPAMGSGHFLVSLVDWLTDATLAVQQEAAALVSWAEYRSPLGEDIERIRAHITSEAQSHGWQVDQEQLDDRHLVRRIVLKRVIYGVDLNPLAVELAKLSLWLHSFTVGAPLSFLDHHLRCGDSLFGEMVNQAEETLRKRGRALIGNAVASAYGAAKGMQQIEELTDADIAEVKQSAAALGVVDGATGPLRHILDLIHAERWLDPTRDSPERRALAALYDGVLGDPVEIASGNVGPVGPKSTCDTLLRFLVRARQLVAERRFLHWEASFPGVWDGWQSPDPKGGFDAVIGNPPWDRIKLQEVEWFGARVPNIAMEQRAADRKAKVTALRKRGGELAREYEHAVWTAEAAGRVCRSNGAYPLLSGGDTNVYSLFVERALRLVRSDGIVGLLVPSGIAADKSAAEFFNSVASNGRLGALLDFENRRSRLNSEPFFPAIDTRFKFSVLVVAGRRRRLPAADCAFFQQSAADAEANSIALTPADFALVNPNTGTAPVFRTKRDAEITLDIYRRLPVLIDHRSRPPKSVWPVNYVTMLHMTNDSGQFRTAAALEGDGAYRVWGNQWKKGKAIWLPLYEGKMVQAFDHRAASVAVNPQNLHRPGVPVPATEAEHRDPDWQPTPQFWVEEEEVNIPPGLRWAVAFKDVTSPTNMRTVIAAIVPRSPAGNTLPLLLPRLPDRPARGTDQWCKAIQNAIHASVKWGPLLLANLNSLIFDFVARQKVQGQHLNFYIMEQMPVLPQSLFKRMMGGKSAESLVTDHVLRLTYTSNDLAPFARDLGYTGKPFAWDGEERLHLRARLDALFFLLYGLDKDAARYVLSTFPIVREQEERRYEGRFRSQDLILGYMAALSAGDPVSRIAG